MSTYSWLTDAQKIYIARFGAGYVSTNCWKALARRMICDERIITYPAQEADVNTFVDCIKAYVTQEKRGTDPFIVNELSGRSKRWVVMTVKLFWMLSRLVWVTEDGSNKYSSMQGHRCQCKHHQCQQQGFWKCWRNRQDALKFLHWWIVRAKNNWRPVFSSVFRTIHTLARRVRVRIRRRLGQSIVVSYPALHWCHFW